MGSSSDEDRQAKKEKKRLKKEKKRLKKEKKDKKRKRDQSPSPATSSKESPSPAAAAAAPVPPPNLAGMTAEEKRKLLGAARAARAKTAYAGTELEDPSQQAKFRRFLGIKNQEADVAAPKKPAASGSKLEEQLAAQFERGRQYQFQGGRGRGLGSK